MAVLDQARKSLVETVQSRQRTLKQVVMASSTPAVAHAQLERTFEAPPPVFSHARRVAGLARAVAQSLNLSGESCADVEHALVHDIGKLAFPSSLIDKDGQFTSEELAIIRTHTIAGAAILINVPYLHAAAAVVAATHERWAGGGFPRGLFNDAIPMPSRIIAVADAFDALTGHVEARRRESATPPTRSWCATPARASTPPSCAPGCARPRRSRPRADHRRRCVIVLGAVLGGFLMAGGALAVLDSAVGVRRHRRRGDRQPADQHAAQDREDADRPRSRARSAPGRRRATTSICWRCSTRSSS